MDDKRICKTCGKIDYSCMCPVFNGTGDKGPRAYTEEEVREKILGYIRVMSTYWAEVDTVTLQERLDGLVLSILVLFDGCSAGFPAINMTLNPRPDDEEWYKKRSKNWFKPGMVINECQMNELWSELNKK